MSNIQPTTIDTINKYENKRKNEIERFIRTGAVGKHDSLHLHACRGGPMLANEIYLSLHEKKKNPSLKKLTGLLHPFNPVGKYILYWYGGTEKEDLKNSLSKTNFEEGPLVSDGSLTDLIYKEARGVNILWNKGVYLYLAPILAKYGDDYCEYVGQFPADIIEEAYSLHDKEIVNMEDFFVELSSFLVNKALRKASLPEVVFEKMEELNTSKSISINTWKKKYSRLNQKYENIQEHSINEINKRLNGYNREIEMRDISKIYDLLSQKKNRSCSKIGFDYLRNYYKNEQNPNQEGIDIIDKLYNNNTVYSESISEKRSTMKFLSGEEMIEECFKYGSNTNTPVILQKFFRPGGYEKYQEMMAKYPTVSTDISSVDIWDLGKFPEYDTNLLFGLNYLKELR